MLLSNLTEKLLIRMCSDLESIGDILDRIEVEDYYHDKIKFAIDENLRIVSVPKLEQSQSHKY